MLSLHNRLLDIYLNLPSFLKVLAASAWGYHLHRWRYGPETEDLVQAALARETWTVEQWRSWQEEKLAYILHRAATKVPYYRDYWSHRRRQGDRASWQYLENWPILDKEPLRIHPRAFVADDCDIKKMYQGETSGTTGKPLTLWFSRSTVRNWYALFEARWRRWYGVSLHDRWAILGGKLIIPFAQKEPPFWVWNAGLKQLYLSTYHLSPAFLTHYLNAIKRYHIKYIYGYSSAIVALAQELIRTGRSDITVSVIITNAEPLFDHQRQVVSQAFQCPVRETYGMSEMVAAASECEAGSLHLWPEVGIVEIMQGDHPVANGSSGDLVCTGLLNTDMPLIRYRVLDRGTLPHKHSPCHCGRSLPILAALDGRLADCLYTSDGRVIVQPDTIFGSDLPIQEAQLVQESMTSVKIRFVPNEHFTEKTGSIMIKKLRDRMGPVQVILEPVENIPRGPNGKFQYVICNIARE